MRLLSARYMPERRAVSQAERRRLRNEPTGGRRLSIRQALTKGAGYGGQRDDELARRERFI